MSRTKEIWKIVESSERYGRLCRETLDAHPDDLVLKGLFAGGRPKFRYILYKGRLHGIGQTWFPNGRLRQQDTFVNGTLHGRQRAWYPNGQLKSEIHYLNGAYHGQRREWFANGRLKWECAYEMNRLQGDVTEWSENGLLKERGRYLDGQWHGVWKEYDREGNIAGRQIYIRGVKLTGKVQRWLEAGRLSVRQVMKIENTALRRICLEEVGYDRFVRESNPDVLDTDGDRQLLRIHWHPDEEPLCLVKVRCPTTGAYYTLRVPPHVKTVNEAVSWTFGLPQEAYHPEEET